MMLPRFQYVSCQFDTLRKLKSVALVRKALQDLPAGLDKTYERMFQSLDPGFQQQTISMLKWLCFSDDSSLSVKELAEIFTLPSQGAIVLDKLEPERLFDAHDVLKYLGGFVVVLYDEYVCLAHFSMKEYLTSSRGSQGPAVAFSFCETEARFHIALSCFRYRKGGGQGRRALDRLHLGTKSAVVAPMHRMGETP